MRNSEILARILDSPMYKMSSKEPTPDIDE